MGSRWSADQTIRAAEGLYQLAVQNRAAMEPRLAAGFIDGLAADASRLRELSSGKVATRADRSAATITQNEAIKRGAELVAKVRRLVRTGAPGNKAMWKAFGVGLKIDPVVGSVQKGLRTLVEGGASFETAARAAGVLPEDLTNAGTLLAAVSTADSTQEGKKLTAKQATAASVSMQKRLEDNLMHLVSIAQITTNGAASQFVALTPRAAPRAKKAAAPS